MSGHIRFQWKDRRSDITLFRPFGSGWNMVDEMIFRQGYCIKLQETSLELNAAVQQYFLTSILKFSFQSSKQVQQIVAALV